MNNRRRRADDFTDSLTSFHQIIHEEKQTLSVSQGNLEDNSEINSMRDMQCESVSNNESRASSIIIAGSLGHRQHISSDLCKIVEDNSNITYNNNQARIRDVLGVSDETSYLSLRPDLNKCINLFHNEDISKEHHTFEEYPNHDSMLFEIKVNKDIYHCHLKKNKTVEVQCDLIRDRPCALSLNSLADASISIKNQDVINKKLQRSKSCSMLYSNLKKDANHNIKSRYFSVASTDSATRKSSYEKIDTILFNALSLSKPSILSNKTNDFHSTSEDQKYDLTNSDTSSKEQVSSFELKTFLHSLEQQKPNETVVQERLLRRLSANFYNSPKTFTEKLLTIIEESVINDDSCAQLEYPEVSLCRLTEELRKMCKFIEDETIPEWPQSPSMSTSICLRQRSREPKSPLQKSINAFTSRDKDLYLDMPVSPRCKIKSPKKICQHTLKTSKNIVYNTKNPLHDSTSTFESLEAFCEKLYADEFRALPIKEKNLLPSQNIESILDVCENQMASLENSLDIHEQLKKAAFTSNLASQSNNKVPETQNLQYKLLTHEKYNKTDSKKISDTFKQWTKDNKSYETIEPDDLENTIMYEIAKKRQRCLDTAKVIMEIDTNSELVKEKQICPKIVNDSLSTNDAKFMETLMSVKRYQEYLEEHKSILNLFRPKSCSSRIPDKKDVQTKEISRKDFGSRRLGDKVENAILEEPEFSRMRKKSRSPLLAKCSTNKLVVSKPRLFVTPGKTVVKKSCKPKRTYFPNLVQGMSKEKNVSSHLKNIYRQIESYDHVVSPVGIYIKGTDPHLMKNLRPKTDENLLTPRKKQIMQSRSPKPKFRLSPKQTKETMTKTVVRDENIAHNFLHPKVHYKLPSHVRTIKETENRKVGNRIKELLRSTQDKVVIRHEDRIKSVQTNYLKQPEIHYDSAEESVHIEQTARKTCFSRIQKN
ncbi:uncharacterized protein LOC126850801 [Cataglyphis hispanica]|uniref:uncharacterized protein LOC126850801 n=1 Tax=Cataglyphis hispanica TaxID=1086592 RepID=UPI00217F3909|nr:uncharacterized protein LOC126850801 [Cataglyphis hispanica]XP_050450099.1 uncharacterized protein LOC126850801 [Cataglyphis hispanica]